MDLEEDWEILSDDGFNDLHENSVKTIEPKGKYSISSINSIIDMNYFHKLIAKDPQTAVPVPVHLDPNRSTSINDDSGVKKATPEEVSVLPLSKSASSETKQIMIPAMRDVPKVEEEASKLEAISHQVSSMKETNQFVDMKLDSPESLNKGILPQFDAGTHQFEEKVGNFDQARKIEMEEMKGKEEEDTTGDDDKSNLWSLGMTGIGALFSFGFACATTICVVALGGSHQQQRENQQHAHRVQFHVFGDKRMKQVVQHANKLNEAIYPARGGRVTRAQITTGGCYHGLQLYYK